MRKGENIISMVLAALILFTVLAIQRKWQPTNLKDMASSAGEFILTTAGIRGGIPEIPGYEKVRTYSLDRYRAGFYRVSPAPLVLANYRFVIYNRDNQPVFTAQSLEGSKNPWTVLYDFAGRHGSPLSGSRKRPIYTRSLTGNGAPDIMIGQYSGGDHCCTIATVVELGKESVKVLAHIDGLDGLPFEGLELRRIDPGPDWEIVAHRPYQTACGSHFDGADVLSVYAYTGGIYTDQTTRFTSFLEGVLRQNQEKWAKTPSLQLLQTLAMDYAMLGRRDVANRFFSMNVTPFIPEMRQKNVDPDACLEDVTGLVDRLASSSP